MGGDVNQQSSDAADTSERAETKKPHGSAKPSKEERWHPEEQKHRKYERRYWLATSVLTAIAAGGAIATTILSIGALLNSQDAAKSARRQAELAETQINVARDTSKREARAYIISSNIRMITYGSQRWEITAIIENTGNTPTRLLRLSEALVGGIQNLDQVGSNFKWRHLGERDFIKTSIGPKSEVSGSKFGFSSSGLTQMVNQIAIGAFGLASYQDVFGDPHIYEFCYLIRIPQIDYASFPIGQSIRTQGFPCEQHNCSDEECGPDWKERATE